MLKKILEDFQLKMFLPLEDMLDQKHGLYILSKKINWQMFEEAFRCLYSDNNGRAKPIRLMVGLLILKHIRKLSDESFLDFVSLF